MLEQVTIYEYAFRIGTAVLLGALIGFERQWQQKDAGLRTNTIVSIGAASYALLSLILFEKYGGEPGRIAAQIVTGIGFIGAGVIMKDGMNVRGLNTAATIWCSAAVGTLAGMGFIYESFLTALAVVISHLILKPISGKMSKLTTYKQKNVKETVYSVLVHCFPEAETKVRFWLLHYIESDNQLMLRSIDRNISQSDTELIILSLEIAIIGEQKILLEKMVAQLLTKQDISHAGWKLLSQEKEF